MIYLYGKFTSGNTCSTITNVLIDSAFKTNKIIANRFFNICFFIFPHITFYIVYYIYIPASYMQTKFPSHIIRPKKLMSSFTYNEQILQRVSVHLYNPFSCIKLLVLVLNLALDNKRSTFFGCF